jgi:hypothetical protein
MGSPQYNMGKGVCTTEQINFMLLIFLFVLYDPAAALVYRKQSLCNDKKANG